MFKKKNRSETIEISMKTTFKNYRFMIFFTVLFLTISIVLLLVGLFTTITYGKFSGIKFDTFLPELDRNVNNIYDAGLFSSVAIDLLYKTSSTNKIGVYQSNNYIVLYSITVVGAILTILTVIPAFFTFILYKKQRKLPNKSVEESSSKIEISPLSNFPEIRDSSKNLL
jgi:hypothetical protein